MAASNYLGIRADEQRQARIRRQELEHVARIPAGEREEVRQIYAAKGLQGDALERVVAAITADPTSWVDTMLVEEHGFAPQASTPFRSAIATFLAFVVVGFVPVAPSSSTSLPTEPSQLRLRGVRYRRYRTVARRG
jgi:hypothetical protein